MRKMFFVLGFVYLLFSCGSSPSHEAQTVIQAQEPYFEGGGGENIRLAILQPAGKGLSSNEQWLLALIQGTLTSDFNKYSAMTVLDRQNLDKILSEQKLSLSGYFSDDDYIHIGNLTNTQYMLTGSLVKIANNAYLFELAITDAETGVRKASYPPRHCTLSEIQDMTVIKEASEELLMQMGVNLTETGKKLLHTIKASSVNAETSLSKGIVAQEKGTVVEALNYYYEATAFDTSLIEASGRLNTLSSTITSGNLSQNILSDIESRKAWLSILKEYISFYKAHPPYQIIYNPVITQFGETDYINETVNLGFDISLSPTNNGFRVLHDILTGLDRTGKRKLWGLDGWPFFSIPASDQTAFLFEGSNLFSIVISTEIINENGAKILSKNITINTSADNVLYGKIAIRYNLFQGIPVALLSKSMGAKITAINGIPTRTVMESGYINIVPATSSDINSWNKTKLQMQAKINAELITEYSFLKEPPNKDKIRGYSGTEKEFWLPDRNINGAIFTSFILASFQNKGLTFVHLPEFLETVGIFSGRFSDPDGFSNNYLTDLIIPDTVKTIESLTFANNQLEVVYLGKNIESIKIDAFKNNRLTQIFLPQSVTKIWNGAFQNNNITKIVIPANVSLNYYSFFDAFQRESDAPSFDNGFVDFYNSNGKKAGTYVYQNRRWTRQ